MGDVELLVGPAEPGGASCGIVREYKIGGRVDPPEQQANGSWRVSGCFYSHGSELWRTEVVLLYETGTGEQRVTVVPVREFVGRDQKEVPFGATIGPGVGGVRKLRAFLVAYVN
ncbi:MAG: hypothetical protein E6I57_04360 [Chloroflexi bacterium]|nr:MAG: hypothetical protein E6J49_09855 [Chloroflexota bacterium]TMB78885.1 MAG: hypothetical protein E6J52_03760 [Chloroflexota bacterium]TMC34274.1 MAG: hypothetical protein E6J24_06830 [Chloroflexota bacterium]TME41666.1 MAG: hypothetical protein E6I57_04360 [Chloroflexota bacterium]